MSFFKKISEKLAFDKPDTRYELLEREKGDPQKMFGWNDIYAQGEEAARACPSSIEEVEKELKKIFRTDINKDVIFTKLRAGSKNILLVHMNGMASANTISEYIIKPILGLNESVCPDLDMLSECCIEIAEMHRETNLIDIKLAIMEGQTALFLNGEPMAIILESRGYEKRSISGAENEKVVRGPKEGFNESLRTNITLVRRIIRSDDLVVETRLSGGDNNTSIAIIYRDGVADRSLIDEVKKRLARINIRMVFSTGIIEQLIEDSPNSPIPQSLATERPDRTANYIMRGGVAVLADGTPFAVIVPITFSTLMSSSEDIYLRKPVGSIMRLVRYIGAAISILLPGYFLALALFHQGLLSTEVLSTIVQSRKTVFEPLGIEMLLILAVFQLIREAGMRVPGSIGQAIGIIGGLIVGQAAVAANIASSMVLIIVALSGLGNFCIPDYSTQLAASYFRIAFMIAAWMGGLLGLSAAFMLFIAYLASLKSFGVPFLAPYAPKTYSKRPLILRGSIKMNHRSEDYINAACDTLPKRSTNE